MEALVERVKTVIVEALHLEEVSASGIDDDAPLFGDSGLGLDSIDALELVLEIERNFEVTIEDSAEGRKVLTSVRTLAGYIHEQKTR